MISPAPVLRFQSFPSGDTQNTGDLGTVNTQITVTRTEDWDGTAFVARYVLWDGTSVKSARSEISYLAQCCHVLILIFYRSIRLLLAA